MPTWVLTAVALMPRQKESFQYYHHMHPTSIKRAKYYRKYGDQWLARMAKDEQRAKDRKLAKEKASQLARGVPRQDPPTATTGWGQPPHPTIP